MIALSLGGIALTTWLGYGGTVAAIVLSALWLSSLSGMVVACVAAGATAVITSRRRKR